MSQSNDVRPFLADYLKHCSTLTTATILLVSGFIEKVFPHPVYKWLVSVSVVLLFGALVGAVVAYSALVNIILTPPESDSGSSVFASAILLMWVGFLLGIGTFGMFFLLNWHH